MLAVSCSIPEEGLGHITLWWQRSRHQPGQAVQRAQGCLFSGRQAALLRRQLRARTSCETMASQRLSLWWPAETFLYPKPCDSLPTPVSSQRWDLKSRGVDAGPRLLSRCPWELGDGTGGSQLSQGQRWGTFFKPSGKQ